MQSFGGRLPAFLGSRSKRLVLKTEATMRILRVARRGIVSDANVFGKKLSGPLAFAVARVGAFTSVANAGIDTWSGGSTVPTNNWTDAGNWVAGVAPLAGDTLIFDGTNQPTAEAMILRQGLHSTARLRDHGRVVQSHGERDHARWKSDRQLDRQPVCESWRPRDEQDDKFHRGSDRRQRLLHRAARSRATDSASTSTAAEMSF